AKALEGITKPSVLEIATEMFSAWKAERTKRAEAHFFANRPGWTLERFFEEGEEYFLPEDVARLTAAIDASELDHLEVMVVSFDENDTPQIMIMNDQSRGMPESRPAFCAIGKGSPNALTFLTWRETSPNTPIRAALSQIVEAKYYGELA